MRRCSEQVLTDHFNPLSENTEGFIARLWNTSSCFEDPYSFSIMNRFDADIGRALIIDVVSCYDGDCASEEEINEWIKDKHILIVLN